jgi:S1-C subfamily serine protease
MAGTPEQFSWNCPTCGRRVPRTVDQCRCGFRQTGDESVSADEPSRTRLLVVVAIGAAALALRSFLLPSEAAAPRPTPPPAAPVVAAPTASVAEPAAPEMAVPIPTDAPALLDAAAPVTGPAAALEDVVARVIPAVAAIQAGTARGTGFFVRTDTVITNAHVVDGHTSVQLQVGDAKYTASVVNVSKSTDLAVLRVQNASAAQVTVRLGSIADVRVGQEVVAIGSALGVLSNTVTRGIVSAVRRAGEVTLIQTDAAINPGNSGGPLLDRGGQVIGINTMKALARAESIGFAVAVDHAMSVLSGRAVSTSATSPVSGLETMLRQGSVSTTEAARNHGQDEYERTMGAIAQRAAQVDGYWDRYASSCVSASPGDGDRRWFAALEPGGVRLANAARINCREWLESVAASGREIERQMRAANETGRRAGVFPGVMREVRRRHRLDSPRWG